MEAVGSATAPPLLEPRNEKKRTIPTATAKAAMMATLAFTLPSYSKEA